ncbi:glycosyltransferase WbuB [Lewinellaceae bacterium SD302]|nr:glycosyltransferase WbuB [Lewinellaceae bacterium SD302]
MKLLFLTDNFPPEVNAPASRTYEHCREWVKAGVEVTVITCAPNFPQGKVYAGYRNRWWQVENMDGIRVIRVWSYITANRGFRRRILDFISFGCTGFLASLFVKTDLIVATSPQFFTAVGGYFSSLFKRKPWVMEVRDLWPESIRAVGAARGREKWLDRMERLELFLYRKASNVVVVTDAFKRNLTERGIEASKVAVVTNGVLPEKFPPRPKCARLLMELGLENKFVVGYLGTHGMAHKLDFILDCAPKVHPDVHFLFIGGGAEKEKLLQRVESGHYPNVTMLPPVLKDKVADYLSITDLALVNLRKSDTFKTVIPSKIFENAAMERPILLGVEGESQQIVERYGAGLCFEPENEESFLQQLDRLRKDRILYENCQSGCAELAKDFDRRRLADNMLIVLNNL